MPVVRTALSDAVLFAASLLVPAADAADRNQSAEAPRALASPAPVTAADAAHCSAKPLGETVVATLDNVPVVTVSADGQPLTLVLDTGADRTVLTPAAAERVGAPTPRIEFDRRMHGIAGAVATHEIELRDFTIGTVPIPWRRLTVAPVTTANGVFGSLDGLLGADVLSGFDIDIDLPHGRLALYDKRSCPMGPPWAGSYHAINTGRSRAEHLFFPVELEGHVVTAIVDTGAQLTTLAARVARAVGVTEFQLAQDRPIMAQGITPERLNSHIHRFSQLKIGDETIRSLELVVTELKLPDVDIILGIDILRARRLWLSYASLQIFMSDR